MLYIKTHLNRDKTKLVKTQYCVNTCCISTLTYSEGRETLFTVVCETISSNKTTIQLDIIL